MHTQSATRCGALRPTISHHAPALLSSRGRLPSPPVILFDGVCNLCNGAVNWIMERDRKAHFRFASLQSDAAREMLATVNGGNPLPDSIVLIDEAGVHTQSDAALRIAAKLKWPWSWLSALRIVPRVLRDAMYNVVARHRYRWFGQSDTCRVPAPHERHRFL